MRLPPIADFSGLAEDAFMSVRPNPSVIGFYVAFALWFTATRYSAPSFYSWLIAPAAQSALSIVTIVLCPTAIVLATRRALRDGSLPWLDLAVVGCTLLGFDLFWRFYLSPLAGDAFKLTSIAVDIATPLIAALGVVAVVREFKQPAHAVVR